MVGRLVLAQEIGVRLPVWQQLKKPLTLRGFDIEYKLIIFNYVFNIDPEIHGIELSSETG